MGPSLWFFGRRPRHVGVMLGLDTSGKTAALFQLKDGTNYPTIPTMGFNVEEINRGSRGDFELWDVGGCDQMRPLIRHYMSPGRFLLYLASCTDSDRLDESATDLHLYMKMAKDHGIKNVFIVFSKQDLIPESDRHATVSELGARFAGETAQYGDELDIRILTRLGVTATDGEALHAVLDDINAALNDQAQKIRNLETEQPGKALQQPNEADLLQRAKEFAAAESTPEAFWQAFRDGSLDSWDHYAHLRSGYFVMLEAVAAGHGILSCADDFLAHLARLREGDPQRFRNTAHRTMTVFWLAQIQLAALRFEDVSTKPVPDRDDFSDIVLNSPELMDSSLWRQYYSKDLMFSPKAREEWCPPDLRPLPAFAAAALAPSPASLPIESNADRLLRFALIVVQASMSSSIKRGALVKRALQALETSTIRLRARDQRVAPYSETQAYFWVQVVHACLRASNAANIADTIDVAEFKRLFGVSGEEWRQHYQAKTWESVAARQAFVLPDIKPLPNVIELPQAAREKMAKDELLAYRKPEELQRNEEVAKLVADAIKAEAEAS